MGANIRGGLNEGRNPLLITHTVSVVEVIWTVICSLGLLYNTKLLYDAVEDHVNVKKNRINGIRSYAAMTTAIMFGSWTLIQFMFVMVGVISMLLPSPAGNVQPLTYILTVVFIFASAFMTVTAYTTNSRRRVLIKRIREIEHGI